MFSYAANSGRAEVLPEVETHRMAEAKQVSNNYCASFGCCQVNSLVVCFGGLLVF